MDEPENPAPPAIADPRAAERFTLLLRAAKLVSPLGEFLCILRDVSATGAKARLFHVLPATERLTLELGSGERYRVEAVWQRDDHAGLRFLDGPADIQALVDESSAFPKRQIRLRLDLPVQLALRGGLHRVGQLGDLSQQGALVRIEPGLALGQPVELTAPGFPLRHARVRWRRRGAHGLVFQEAFRLDELARLAARLQLGEQLAIAPELPRPLTSG